MNLQITLISTRTSDKRLLGTKLSVSHVNISLLHSGNKFNIFSEEPSCVIPCWTYLIIYSLWSTKVFWKVTIFEIHSKNIFNEKIRKNTFGTNLLFTANKYFDIFSLLECNWNTLNTFWNYSLSALNVYIYVTLSVTRTLWLTVNYMLMSSSLKFALFADLLPYTFLNGSQTIHLDYSWYWLK